MLTRILFIVVAIVFLGVCSGFKVFLLPLPSKSHMFSLTTIGQELVKKGHEVHMLVDVHFRLSEDLTSSSSPIVLHRYGTKDDGFDYDKITENMTMTFMTEKKGLREVMSTMPKELDRQCRSLLSDNEELIATLESVGFDMAVVDSAFVMKYAYLIPHRLGIPWVTYTDFIEPWLVRVPWLPSFVPLKISSFTEKMTFVERLQNTIFIIMFGLFPWMPEPSEEVVQPYRKYGSFNSMNDLVSRSLLFITTDDVVLDYPHPQMPNMIHAGGLTVKPASPENLPEKFRNFMDRARKGTIIVSFGSMASNFPDDIAQKFLTTFARLGDYRFIWRFKNINKRDIPENVMIAKWLPQNDLLASPGVKLFITHSGNNGQFESVCHGVPMIGFPLIGDQPFNARRIEHKGYGIAMSITDFTSDELTGNILKVIGDVNYKNRVSLASAIFRNALQTPGERAAFWIEHVTKFGGDHLRSAGNDLSLLEYMMLDILAVFLLVLLLITFCCFSVVRLILKITFRIRSNINLKNKKTN